VKIFDINRLDDSICIVLAIFLLAIIIQLVYYLLVYLRVVLRAKKRETSQTNNSPPVSVIICARNEEENLIRNLTSVLEQDYPLFEVVVVNDCSEDDTEQALAELKQKYLHLRSTVIKQNGSFRNEKKFAATVGIRAAQHEWLLFTDANCRPENSQWIKSMSRHFVDKKDIVLGYAGYLPQKGFLNKWICYDTCFNALQYFGFAKMGKAYIGVGRNLAYRKSLFLAHNGFAEHAHIPSGIDDLFVNQAATSRNVAVSYIKDAHMRSTSKTTFKEWLRQKRWRTVIGKHYRSGRIFQSMLEPFSRVLMWASFVTLMILCPFWEYVLMVFMARMIFFIMIIGAAAKRLNEPGVLQYAILFDLIMPFVNFYAYVFSGVSSKHNKWK